MTEPTGNPQTDISAEALSKMSHSDLVLLRDKETNPERQQLLAPYEHRAFAREYVSDGNVVTSAAKAVGLAAAIPAYQAKKVLSPKEGETPASASQMTEAVKGVVEGIVEPWKRLWNDGVKKAAELVSGTPPEAITAPTAPWMQNWGGSRDVAKIMAPTPVKPSDFKATLASFTPKLEKLESSGNPTADNPQSSALGLHQFTQGTWNSTVKAMGKDYSLADRTDPDKSREVFAFFTEQNAKKAEKDLGRTPQEHELYAYHLLGRTGGGDLLQASAAASAPEVVGVSRAKKNAGLFYKDPKTKEQPRTVAEVLEVFKGKFSDTPDYGNRQDGTKKGEGFFGAIPVPGTKTVATEYSIGVNIGGKELDIPTIVPTLTKAELDTVIKAIPNNGKIPESIIQKAVDHARERINQGKSPFADRTEKRKAPK